jgi:hypothetical protein
LSLEFLGIKTGTPDWLQSHGAFGGLMCGSLKQRFFGEEFFLPILQFCHRQLSRIVSTGDEYQQ